jgi:hypothetical protein
MIKPRRMRWAGNAACMETKINKYRIVVKSQKERDHYEDQVVGGRVRWILER